jgi:ABC-type uncharacterized transport system permease subunit
MNPAYPGLAAAALYFVGASLQIRNLMAKASSTDRRVFYFAVPALLLHGTTVYLVINQSLGIDLGFYSVLSLIALVLTAFVAIMCAWQPLNNLLLIILPFAGLAVIGSLAYPGTPIATVSFSAGLLTHVLISIAAYTVLAAAACQSVVLAVQERGLRHHTSIGVLRLLPPLQTMEALLFQYVWLGLMLLTLSIASGFLFLDDMFAQRVVHHTVLASASWVIFATLLLGRTVFGWRGATASRWTLVGFGLLLLAYLGSKFVIEIILGRT